VRGAAPTPRELFGSSTTFPIKDREILPPPGYSSHSFRQSLDFEKTPTRPPPHSAHVPDIPAFGSGSALANVKAPSSEFDDLSSKATVHDIRRLSSQLTGLTTIATNLQREMSNLSRRSKDNATDLMAIKEAARNRDEEIRRSLRDLQSGLTSFEAADRLLEGRHPPLALLAPSTSSGCDRGSNYGDDALLNPKLSAASTQVLDKILREMPTKAEQDHALDLLQDIKEILDSQQRPSDRSDAEEKILSVLEEIRDREDSRGKEVALVGPRPEQDDEKVLLMLEELRRDLQQEKTGEEKIISILEEIREKDNEERSDDRILSAIDDMKGTDGNERLDHIISLLEELKLLSDSQKLVTLFEELKDTLRNTSGDFVRASVSSEETSSISGTTPTQINPDNEIIAVLHELKHAVDSGGSLGEDIKRLVQDWRESWSGYDLNVSGALKDLGSQIETLAAVQRAAVARLPNGPTGIPSQALMTMNPPLPPDLDNEAAITALANIASTTTRTDITLSSINALIKVFQKETHASNTNTTEALSALGRFLEDFGRAVTTNNSQGADVRKVLEVVRTGVCSGNDKLAAFESQALRQIDELSHLHKHLQRTIMGDDDEALWKVDLGVKDDVEELSRKVDELCDKNVQALKTATATTVDAIKSSNPGELIEELKTALGAMAQRSLDAFKRSEDAIQQLKEESTNSAEKNIEAIQQANPTVAITDFRAEVKEMAEKSLAICEAINARCGFDEVKDVLAIMKEELSSLISGSSSATLAEATNIKLSIDKFREELDAKMEDSLTTAVALASADEKTSAALADLKSEVSDTLLKAVTLSSEGNSEKILAPIQELRQEITDMIEKSNSALAAPVHYPEADEIKARIEFLARELYEAMEKTAALAAETAISNADVGAQVKNTVEALRQDINSMNAVVAGNSASAIEEGVKKSFDEMKETVLAKVEQSLLTSDKAVSCIADLSQQTRDSIDVLKKDVMGMMDKSISLAVTTVKPDETETLNKILLDSLETRITDVIISTMAASMGSEELKELIEGLKGDVDVIGKQMALPASSEYENTTKILLDSLETRITDVIISTMAASMGSEELKELIEGLKGDVDVIGKQMALPVSSEYENTTKILLDSLETRITDVIISTMAASMGSEELKELIEGLKGDVDVIGKQMALPASSEYENTTKNLLDDIKNDTADILNKVLVSLKAKQSVDELRIEVQDMIKKTSSMIAPVVPVSSDGSLDKLVESIAGLKDDINDIVERTLAAAIANSTFDSEENVKEALEELKRDVKDTLEKSMVPLPQQANTESSKMVRESMEVLRQELAGMFEKRSVGEAEDRQDMVSRLDALKGQFGELLEKSTNVEVKEAVDVLKIQVYGLLEKSSGAEYAELRDMIKAWNSQMVAHEPLPADDETNVILEALRGQVEELACKLFDVEFKETLESLKSQTEKISDRSMETLEALKIQTEKISERSMETLDTTELTTITEDLKTQIQKLRSMPTSAPVDISEQLKSIFNEFSENMNVEELKTAIDSLKTDFEVTYEATTSGLAKVEDFIEIKLLIEGLQKDLSETTEKQINATKGMYSIAISARLKLT
jgi:hypothetical protein